MTWIGFEWKKTWLGHPYVNVSVKMVVCLNMSPCDGRATCPGWTPASPSVSWDWLQNKWLRIVSEWMKWWKCWYCGGLPQINECMGNPEFSLCGFLHLNLTLNEVTVDLIDRYKIFQRLNTVTENILFTWDSFKVV